MKNTINSALPHISLPRAAANPSQKGSLRTHITNRERMCRLREADPAVPDVIHRVEPLEPRHSVDEVESRPGDRAIVGHDQVVPLGVAPDVRVQL